MTKKYLYHIQFSSNLIKNHFFLLSGLIVLSKLTLEFQKKTIRKTYKIKKVFA